MTDTPTTQPQLSCIAAATQGRICPTHSYKCPWAVKLGTTGVVKVVRSTPALDAFIRDVEDQVRIDHRPTTDAEDTILKLAEAIREDLKNVR